MFDHILSMILEETTSIPVQSLLVAVCIACLCGILVSIIYRCTFGGVLFSRQFALSLVLLSMVTSAMILAISSNLVLSLGMVGALSIVRFRTAIKEPMDTVFMFWSLAAGILAGAGFLFIALLATLLIGALFILLYYAMGALRAKRSCLLMLICKPDCKDLLPRISRHLSNVRVKSQRFTDTHQEFVLEVILSDQEQKKLSHLHQLEGVQEVNLVTNELEQF